MIYGFTGASCAGKKTLGRQLSQKLGIPFIPIKITEIASELGLPSTVDNLDFMERITVQYKILCGMEVFLNDLTTSCIIDRTPIDLIAYMLAEINMHSLTNTLEIIDSSLVEFYHSCIELTKEHVDRLYCLDYLPHYDFHTKRPTTGQAYQMHRQLLIKGAMSQLTFHGVVAQCLSPYVSPEEHVDVIYKDISEDMAQNVLAEAKFKILN